MRINYFNKYLCRLSLVLVVVLVGFSVDTFAMAKALVSESSGAPVFHSVDLSEDEEPEPESVTLLFTEISSVMHYYAQGESVSDHATTTITGLVGRRAYSIRILNYADPEGRFANAIKTCETLASQKQANPRLSLTLSVHVVGEAGVELVEDGFNVVFRPGLREHLTGLTQIQCGLLN